MEQKDVERRVFRKLISNPKTLAANLNKVSPEDFTLGLPRVVLGAMGQNGYSIQYDPSPEYFEILLRDKIKDQNELGKKASMLASLAKKPETQTDLDILITELKNFRRCKEVARIVKNAIPNITPGAIEKTYESLVKSLLELPFSGSSAHSVGVMHEAFDDLDARLDMYHQKDKVRMRCGLKAFDDAIGGFSPGEFAVMTAGTGMGKSALKLWFAENFMRGGRSVLYITIEMEYNEIMERWHSMITGMPMREIANKLLKDDDLALYNERIVAHGLKQRTKDGFLRECAGQLLMKRLEKEHLLKMASKYKRRDERFFVLDIPKNCTPSRIEREISRLALDHPVDVVFVDYLNIMDPNYHNKDYVREQASIAKDLKAVARKTKVFLMAGAQLNTANLKDGQPIGTDDIKYSRAICENADWVLAFRRDQNDIDTKVIKLELAKHRRSAACVAAIDADFEHMRFRDLGSSSELPDVAPTKLDENEKQRDRYRTMHTK